MNMENSRSAYKKQVKPECQVTAGCYTQKQQKLCLPLNLQGYTSAPGKLCRNKSRVRWELDSGATYLHTAKFFEPFAASFRFCKRQH